MARPLVEAVLFDLDGTLVATDRFWIPAARLGARRAFEELGLERPLPSAREWMRLVGYPFDQGLKLVLPDLDADALAVVEARCVEEEHNQLRAGGAALMPGAAGVFDGLKGAGVRIGVASNCTQLYLDHMQSELEPLGSAVEAARCLETRGIEDKAQMIEDLCQTFATRNAIFVGDRRTDGDAARANGLPFVHCAFGFAEDGEGAGADAELETLSGLLPLLARRADRLNELLSEVGCSGARGAGTGTLGVTGEVAVGKTLLARDLATLVRATGQHVRLLELDSFVRAEAPASDDPLAHFDLEAFGAAIGRERESQPDGLVIVEGPFLLDPRVRGLLDRVVLATAGDEACLQRVAGRAGRWLGPEAVAAYRRSRAAQRLLPAGGSPGGPVDAVLDLTWPLEPVLVHSDTPRT